MSPFPERELNVITAILAHLEEIEDILEMPALRKHSK